VQDKREREGRSLRNREQIYADLRLRADPQQLNIAAITISIQSTGKI
jgi:hypothetical protein